MTSHSSVALGLRGGGALDIFFCSCVLVGQNNSPTRPPCGHQLPRPSCSRRAPPTKWARDRPGQATSGHSTDTCCAPGHVGLSDGKSSWSNRKERKPNDDSVDRRPHRALSGLTAHEPGMCCHPTFSKVSVDNFVPSSCARNHAKCFSMYVLAKF